MSRAALSCWTVLAAGLKITNNLVSFLARNHPNIVREVLELCDASAVDKLYVAFTTTVVSPCTLCYQPGSWAA